MGEVKCGGAAVFAGTLCELREPARAFRKRDSRTTFGEWLSLVEHLVRDQGVGGSNPLAPTTLNQQLTVPIGIVKNPDVVDFVAVRASKNTKRIQ